MNIHYDFVNREFMVCLLSLMKHIIFVKACKILIFTSQRANAEYGVSSAGFNTTVQPAAMAGPAFLVIMA